MARKVFFAAFVIHEEAYTPEPGPVDRHFVAADLAQSSFGEQSGVSSIIVWSSAEDLITDYLLGDESEMGVSTVDFERRLPKAMAAVEKARAIIEERRDPDETN